MGLFQWLRDRARRAVIEGVQLAVADLQAAPAEVEPVRLVLTDGDDERPVGRKEKR
jgi:hypothetical protein